MGGSMQKVSRQCLQLKNSQLASGQIQDMYLIFEGCERAYQCRIELAIILAL